MPLSVLTSTCMLEVGNCGVDITSHGPGMLRLATNIHNLVPKIAIGTSWVPQHVNSYELVYKAASVRSTQNELDPNNYFWCVGTPASYPSAFDSSSYALPPYPSRHPFQLTELPWQP